MKSARRGPEGRRPWSRATTLTGVLLFAASVASSQTILRIHTREDPGTFRLGPVHLSPRLQLVNAGVDSNVYNSPDGPVSDQSALFRAAVDAFIPVRQRLRLMGTAALDFSYFNTESSQRSHDPGFEGRAELDAWRFMLFGGGGALRSSQRFTTDIDERIRREEGWYEGGADLKLTRRLSLRGRAESRTFTFAESTTSGSTVSQALDRETVTLDGEVRYGLTTLTSLVGSAESIEDRFTNSPPPNRVQSYRYLGGFEFRPKGLLSGRALFGWRNFPTQSAAAPAYNGFAADTQLSMPLRFVSFSLRGLRDTGYSATPVETQEERLRNMYVLGRFGGSAQFALPWDLSFVADLDYGRAEYLLPYERDGVLAPRVDNQRNVRLSLLKTFGRSLRLGGDAQRIRRTSSFAEFNYEGWQYGIRGEFTP